VEKTSLSRLERLWRTARPWLLPLALVLVLRITGALAVISQLSGSLLLRTGLLNASTDAPAVMHPFPYEFRLRDLEGQVVDVSRWKGKMLFVNIWATWCGPCRVEMPSIEALYRGADSSKVEFLMISVDDEADLGKIKSFVSDKGFSFPVYQPVGSLPELLKVRSIPSTFIVDTDGKVIVRESGLANYDTDAVKALLRPR